MKHKAKLRPLERVSEQEASPSLPTVRVWKHNSSHDFRVKVMELMPQTRIQAAKERIQADSKSINLAIANGAKWNPGQERTVLGPRGSVEMLTPTREDYKRKNRGKSGAPLSLEALAAREYTKRD